MLCFSSANITHRLRDIHGLGFLADRTAYTRLFLEVDEPAAGATSHIRIIMIDLGFLYNQRQAECKKRHVSALVLE